MSRDGSRRANEPTPAATRAAAGASTRTTRVIRARPEALYDAFVDPAALVEWLPPDGMDLQAHLDAIERKLLEEALARCGGVKTEAARVLRLTFRSLRYRLAKYGIG